MARPKRSEINDDNRREALIRTAVRLFNKKGFRGTTVRDIASATGMHSGSPFYHFSSKQDLLSAATLEGLEPALKVLEAIRERDLPAVDTFRALARAHVGLLIGSDRDTVALVNTEWRFLEGEQLARVIAIRDRFEQVWQQALDDLAAAGYLGKAGPPVRLLFLGALHGVCQWYRQDGPLTPEQVADALVELVLGRNGATAAERAT